MQLTNSLPGSIGLGNAAFGLVPITAGVVNVCPIAPAWGGHFFGVRHCARPISKEDAS